MNCEFKILWFEDELIWFNVLKYRIEDFLSNYNLKSCIKRKIGNDFSPEELCVNSYDLILMDYRLTEGITGDQIGSKIRECHVLTDILFYSSDDSAMCRALYKATPPIDGFYFSNRNNDIFFDKTKMLINKIVKRSEDLVNLRGFVMDTSCDLEVRIHEILCSALEKFNDHDNARLYDKTMDIIKNKEKNIKKLYEKIDKNSYSMFKTSLKESHLFTNSDKLNLLNEIISILKSEYGFSKAIEPTVYDNFKHNYEKDISIYRNALGHKKQNDDSIEAPKGTFLTIDSNLHKMMRGNLIKYDELVHIVENYMNKLREIDI